MFSSAGAGLCRCLRFRSEALRRGGWGGRGARGGGGEMVMLREVAVGLKLGAMVDSLN